MIQALLAEYQGVIGWARERMTDPERIDRRPLQAILLPAPVVPRSRPAHRRRRPLDNTPPCDGSRDRDRRRRRARRGAGRRDSLDAALEVFMDRRFERCRLVVENSLQLGEWEKHPDDPDADPAGLSNASFAALAAPF